MQGVHNDDMHGDSPSDQTDDTGGNMPENVISTPMRDRAPPSTAKTQTHTMIPVNLNKMSQFPKS